MTRHKRASSRLVLIQYVPLLAAYLVGNKRNGKMRFVGEKHLAEAGGDLARAFLLARAWSADQGTLHMVRLGFDVVAARRRLDWGRKHAPA